MKGKGSPGEGISPIGELNVAAVSTESDRSVGCWQEGVGHDKSRGFDCQVLLPGIGAENPGICSTATMVPI